MTEVWSQKKTLTTNFSLSYRIKHDGKEWSQGKTLTTYFAFLLVLGGKKKCFPGKFS